MHVPHDQCGNAAALLLGLCTGNFDLPSAIYDLPFLTEKARHNILGGNAARLFKLSTRNDRQSENLRRFGNLTAVG